VSKNAYSVIVISYSLVNQGFASSPPMHFDLELYFNNTPDYTFNATRVNRAVNPFDQPSNSSVKDVYGSPLYLTFHNSTADISLSADLGSVPARSVSLLNIFIERVILNNRTESDETALVYYVAVTSSDNSTVLNDYLPSDSDMYQVYETDTRRKKYHGDDDSDEVLDEEGKILVGVFVTVGVLLIGGVALCIYCKYCRRKKLDQPEFNAQPQGAFGGVDSRNIDYSSHFAPSAPPKESGFTSLDPKEVSMDLSLH
jgi:hypothetical protein